MFQNGFAYHGWVSKSSNKVSNVVDDVKTKLQRISHSINETQVKEVIQSLKS